MKTYFLIFIFLISLVPVQATTLAGLPDLTLGKFYGFFDIEGNEVSASATVWPHIALENKGNIPVLGNVEYTPGMGPSFSVWVAVSTNPEFLNLMKYSDKTFQELQQYPEFWSIVSKDLIMGPNNVGYSYAYGMIPSTNIPASGTFDFFPPRIYEEASIKHSSVTFPSEGSYYVFIWVDYDNHIPESDEGNNMFVSEVNIGKGKRPTPSYEPIRPKNYCEEQLELCKGRIKGPGDKTYTALHEGEKYAYTLDGENYQVEVVLIEDVGILEKLPEVMFNINGEIIKLIEGYPKQLSDGASIELTKIIYGRGFGRDRVEFYLNGKGINNEEACRKIYEECKVPQHKPIPQPYNECKEIYQRCIDEVKKMPQGKCGVNTFNVYNECSIEGVEYGFRTAYWQCHDGKEENQGGETSCKPSEVWSKYAQESCQNHCSSGDDSDYEERLKKCNAMLEECEQMPKKPIPPTRKEPEPIPQDGCYYSGRIIPIGTRVDGMYCSYEGTLERQKQPEEPANDNYECRSNLESNGYCVDVQEQLSILNKIFGFLSNLFR